MQATEKKNKIWLSLVSVGVVIAIILGVVALVNHNETKANAIPTINQQVDNIKNTLPELEAVSTELKGYIDNLETTAQKLQTDLTATNTALDALETEVYSKVDAEKTATLNQLKADKTELEGKIAAANKDHDADVADLQKQLDTVNTNIASLKTELEGKISESEKKVLGDLNTVKTALEAQLTTINNTIKVLQEKDTELDGKITDLKAYVDSEITKTETWASTTFSTLKQYNETQTAISGINALIVTINNDIDKIEAGIEEKVTEIKKSISDLDTELKKQVETITNGYTAAIATAKTEITTAYTKAIEDAIKKLDTDMKAWVNKTVAEGYYDMTEIDGKITALETKITNGDTALQAQITTLKADLEQAKNDLTAAYKQAIVEAITEYNGEITAEIAAAVEAAKTELQAKINTINNEINYIKSRLANLETDVTALKEQIQSVTFVPLYNDGAVKMAPDADGSKYAFFDFRVSPKAAAAALNASDLTMEAVYTTDAAQRGDTRGSVDTVTLKILEVSGDANTGIVTVKVSGANLSTDFYNGTVSASAVLTIKTGATEIVSDYVPMVAHSQVWTNIVSVQDWIEATLAGGEAEQNN